MPQRVSVEAWGAPHADLCFLMFFLLEVYFRQQMQQSDKLFQHFGEIPQLGVVRVAVVLRKFHLCNVEQ